MVAKQRLQIKMMTKHFAHLVFYHVLPHGQNLNSSNGKSKKRLQSSRIEYVYEFNLTLYIVVVRREQLNRVSVSFSKAVDWR